MKNRQEMTEENIKEIDIIIEKINEVYNLISKSFNDMYYLKDNLPDNALLSDVIQSLAETVRNQTRPLNHIAVRLSELKRVI